MVVGFTHLTAYIALCFLLIAQVSPESFGAEQPPTCFPSESETCSQRSAFQFDPNASILTYLNPEIFEDEEYLKEMSEAIKRGDLVIIEDAFDTELAEYIWEDLGRDDLDWQLMEDAHDDGFHYHHHNIHQDMEEFSERMEQIHGMFNHPDSKRFMSEFSGRDCEGSLDIPGGASYYKPGDHSLPHTDYNDKRTVAFVWHLTKDWTPEWGGALFFCPAHAHQPFVHASFNTLHLFSVSPNSTHFVTVVSPYAESKRLAFNGWYESDWEPTSAQDVLDLTPEEQLKITADQLVEIREIDSNDASLSPEDQNRLREMQRTLTAQLGNQEDKYMLWA